MAEKVFIQLGRFGDLIILLPCWKKLYDDFGQKPIVVVAREFADLFRGLSYVQPDIVNCHWYGGLANAIKMAQLKYGDFIVTQCHGVGYATNKADYPSFGEAMWSKADFAGQYGTLPTIFDRRNAQREQRLLEPFLKDKPILAYNFFGLSSPLPYRQEIYRRLWRYYQDFTFVDLGRIKAERIYDLLGIYDVAAGVLSMDTATLHLASASPVPLLAYCRGGWSSAIPKPGAVKIEYAEALDKLDLIDNWVSSLKTSPAYA